MTPDEATRCGCYIHDMKLHDHDGRELRRVFVTVRPAEAEALLRMIRDAARGVDESRKASEPATGFMFVLDGEGPSHQTEILKAPRRFSSHRQKAGAPTARELG